MESVDTMLVQILKSFGVGHRKLDDELFSKDLPPPRLGVYDVDEENLCHELLETKCSIPGCKFTATNLLEFENHYNCSHRYTCSQCKRVLPSPHLLDLHIQETHDSFFAVMAEKRPSYCCYIEECKEKFIDANERLEHCVKIHKLPKDFRFEQKQQKTKKSKTNIKMEVDDSNSSKVQQKKGFQFNNSKQKGFSKYTGKKFTNSEKNTTKGTQDVDMDDIVKQLKASLPE